MTNRGKDRLDSAILSHLGNLYPYAKNAHSNGLPSTNAELADAIRRPIGEEEYNAANPMSLPEEKLDEYLSRMTMTTRDVAKIVTAFDAAPYGWAKVPTIYFLNELVRRRKWAFSFNNVKNVLPNIVAQNIMSSTSSFTMESADVIPAELVRQFTAAWDDIFGNAGSQHSSDAFELFDKCKSALSDGYIRNNRTLYHQIESYPFKTSLYTLIEKQETWAANRDAIKFFTAVIADREEAKALADKRKQLSSFYESFVKDRGGYVTMLEFIVAMRRISITSLAMTRLMRITSRLFLRTSGLLTACVHTTSLRPQLKQPSRRSVTTTFRKSWTPTRRPMSSSKISLQTKVSIPPSSRLRNTQPLQRPPHQILTASSRTLILISIIK